ncbi:hypothetical protein FB567DRAFT_549190 [Paraphoma chrysanthemicola]|uniref:Uncharacterized protein n=1 Tax=Paraphoma chrysanthemicola TaxID=798071 RepID=A0A8K0R4C8_9PLEO|nr:hypothetical protein FB567DRAFT_549190 [Paraphoma chrysanthemicola]
MAASPLPIELSNDPAPPDISKPILPEDLVKYTGWFRTNAGARIVITRYCSQLSLGHIDGIHGEITRSYSLQLEGVGRVRRKGRTPAEKELNRDIEAMAMATPGDFNVYFGVKQGKITHVGVGEARYKRTERGVCLITTLPAETREMIWKYALGGALQYDGGEDAKWDSVILTEDKMTGEAIITGDLEKPWNLIRCVCKDFRNDAKLSELWGNNTLMSNTSSVTKLLRPMNVQVAHYLRRLILHFGWGGRQQPPQSQLFSILDFALSTPTCSVKVYLSLWKNAGAKAEDVYYFMQQGVSMRKAIRAAAKTEGTLHDPVIHRHWRGNRPVDQLDAPNARFFPCHHENMEGEDMLVCASQKKAIDVEDVVVRACRRKVMKPVRIWYNLGEEDSSSSDKILDEVEGWFKSGF